MLQEDSGGLSADQGTNAHALLEHGIVEGEIPADLSAFVWPKPEAGCPPELVQQARDCLAYASRRQEEMKPAMMAAEFSADPAAFTGRTDGGGTADVVIAGVRMLETVDLKTGGSFVDASDPQLMIYAAGVLANYMNADDTTGIEIVRMTVFQPKRPGKDTIERYVDMTPADLIQWVNEVYIPAAQATDDPNAVGTPGKPQCDWCKARHSCEYKNAKVRATTAGLFLPVGQDSAQAPSVMDSLLSNKAVAELTPEELAQHIDGWPLLAARSKDIHERAKAMLLDRKAVPGQKLVAGKGGRKWSITDQEELAKKLKNLKIKKADVFQESIRSVPQLQKVGLDVKIWERVQKFVTKTTGALTMVPESDPRANACPIVSFDPVVENTSASSPAKVLASESEVPALPSFLK